MSSGSWLPRPALLQFVLLAAAPLALAACDRGEAPVLADKLVQVEATQVEEAQVETIGAEQLDQLLREEKVRLIDVRTDAEVAEGMIPGAEHIALDNFDPARLDLSDGREAVLYCRTDRRSGIAAEKLSRYTGRKARHLKGGFEAWRKARLPVRLY